MTVCVINVSIISVSREPLGYIAKDVSDEQKEVHRWCDRPRWRGLRGRMGPQLDQPHHGLVAHSNTHVPLYISVTDIKRKLRSS